MTEYQDENTKELDRLEDRLRQALGVERLLDELLKALTTDQRRENLEFIARTWDVDESEGEE